MTYCCTDSYYQAVECFLLHDYDRCLSILSSILNSLPPHTCHITQCVTVASFDNSHCMRIHLWYLILQCLYETKQYDYKLYEKYRLLCFGDHDTIPMEARIASSLFFKKVNETEKSQQLLKSCLRDKKGVHKDVYVKLIELAVDMDCYDTNQLTMDTVLDESLKIHLLNRKKKDNPVKRNNSITTTEAKAADMKSLSMKLTTWIYDIYYYMKKYTLKYQNEGCLSLMIFIAAFVFIYYGRRRHKLLNKYL